MTEMNTMVESLSSYKAVNTELDANQISPGSLHCKRTNPLIQGRNCAPIVKMVSSQSNPFLRCLEQNKHMAASMKLQKDTTNSTEAIQSGRIGRLRKPKRVQDYYYSDDDEAKIKNGNKSSSEDTMVKNIKKEVQDKYFEKIEENGYSPLKRKRCSSNSKSRSISPENSLDLSKRTEPSYQREVLLPRENEVANDIHSSCNRCVVILQRRIIETERMLQQQVEKNCQLKKDLVNEKKARMNDANLLAQSFTSFGRHYDRLERNLSRVLINNGVHPNSGDPTRDY